jgi:hypothetical protein
MMTMKERETRFGMFPALQVVPLTSIKTFPSRWTLRRFDFASILIKARESRNPSVFEIGRLHARFCEPSDRDANRIPAAMIKIHFPGRPILGSADGPSRKNPGLARLTWGALC